MLVEDNGDVREALVLALRSDGYNVTEATDGREALAQLRSGLVPSLILLDYHMPDMDGRAFRLRQLAENIQTTVPVVLYSADPAIDASDLALAAFIPKPVSIDRILKVVEHRMMRVRGRAR